MLPKILTQVNLVRKAYFIRKDTVVFYVSSGTEPSVTGAKIPFSEL